jgi:SAM-dependent methyltransferase
MSKPNQNEDFRETFAHLAARYAQRVRKFGDGPQCVEHRDQDSQERRMRELICVGDLRNAKVLDFGCGSGHLYSLLKKEFDFQGEYVGYDITPEMIDLAKEKHPDARFEVRNILAEGVQEYFDYVLISGTFNNLTDNNAAWMQTCLKQLFEFTRVAIAFNNLSTYVDYIDDHLYYANPEDVFRYCKEQLSPLVTLRHDYCIRDGVVPFEFTTYVHQTDIHARIRLTNV